MKIQTFASDKNQNGVRMKKVILTCIAVLTLLGGHTQLKAQNMEEEKNPTTSVAPRLSEAAVRNHEAWFPGYVSTVKQTDRS